MAACIVSATRTYSIPDQIVNRARDDALRLGISLVKASEEAVVDQLVQGRRQVAAPVQALHHEPLGH